MTDDEFIQHVQARARLSSRGEAERATRATLETLGARLADPAAGTIARHLPPQAGRHLTQARGTERFGLGDFLARVSEEEACPRPEAVSHAQAVLEVAREALTPGAWRTLRDVLPDDFTGLLDVEHQRTARGPRG